VLTLSGARSCQQLVLFFSGIFQQTFLRADLPKRSQLAPTENILIAIALGAIAVTLIGLALRRPLQRERRHWDKHDHKHGFWYEFIKDFAAPVLLALLGIFLGYQFNKQRDTEAENQRKAAILRDMMTSRNGPDVAFFTAVGDRLTVYLRRYQKFHEGKDGTEKETAKDALVDERAIYFFYGMFRVARMDFLATKGYVLYPRVWMEEAFSRITDSIIKDFMGGDEDSLTVSPSEEAALYHYFGASRATYHTGSKHPEDSIPDLFDFTAKLDGAERDVAASRPIEDKHVAELLHGFQNFQLRLHDKCIHSQQIITSFEAIVGLDDYAFNTLFSNWYQQFYPQPPVTDLPEMPPAEFLPFPLDTFEFISTNPAGKKADWCRARISAWNTILHNLPDELKGHARVSGPSLSPSPTCR
jgi:hypothetical protein